MKIILILLLLTSTALAGNLRQPPPQADTALNDYLLEVQRSDDRIRFFSSNPDGSVVGSVGDIAIWTQGSAFYIGACTEASSNTWRGVRINE